VTQRAPGDLLNDSPSRKRKLLKNASSKFDSKFDITALGRQGGPDDIGNTRAVCLKSRGLSLELKIHHIFDLKAGS
jgi:hypothetical protein